MSATNGSWEFVIALVAVINGLGVVRLLGAFSLFLHHRNNGATTHFWVYYVLGFFQFMVHILFWWSIVGLREAGEINFLQFLYLLMGPTVLFLATSVLITEIEDEEVDLRKQYLDIRKDYFTLLPAFWIWVIFIWPVFVGSFAPTVPFVAAFLAISLILRFTGNLRVHGYLMVANCLLYAALIALYAIELGQVGRSVIQT